MNFIVAYDIADPKRLKNVARTLEQFGRRVQKSVFIFTGSRKQLDAVIDCLVSHIDISADRIQAWPIRTSTRACRIDVGVSLPDTGVALVICEDHWSVIEAVDDNESHEPIILE